MAERPALRVIPRPMEGGEEDKSAKEAEAAPSKKRATNPQVQAWNDKFQSDPGAAPLSGEGARPKDVFSTSDEGGKGGPNIKLLAAGAVAFVIVAVIVTVARGNAPKPVTEIEEAVLLDDEIQKEVDRRAAIPNVPTCWETDEGYRFEYTGKSGRIETVGVIGDVPVLYRLQARCIRE